jgi:alpha-1,6-mannosyltransferase
MSIKGIIDDQLERRPGQILSYIVAFVGIGLYIQLAFFIVRTNSAVLIGAYTLLFLFYLLLVRSVLSFRVLLLFGIVYRLIFVFSIPALSDDFFRFFWDGILILNRINPFLYVPSEIMENPAINIPELRDALYAALNSPEYHTIYPPVCQFVFWTSAYLGEGNIFKAILIMKSLMFIAEMGTIYLLWNLLKFYKLKKELTLFYILNPLIIIELTGNIHFEALMIIFTLLAAFYISRRQWIGGAMAFALAVASKLTPLLLLPFVLKRLKLRKTILFYLLTFLLVALTFVPFMGQELVHGMSSSIGLYFQKFEFNASVFYIIREIGLWVTGYNIIQTAGISMGILTFTLIVFLALYENATRQNLPGVFIWPLFIYFTFSTIVHPWYAAPLVAFCLFSRYRFPIVWSYTIFLSYIGYTSTGFQEQTWVLWVEYLSVFGVMIYEVLKYKDLVSIKNPWHEISN